MSDLQSNLEQIKSKENFFEKIKRWIPGYDGYVNRDNSRELDTLLRNQLASKLEENKVHIKNSTSALSNNGKLFEAGNIDKIDKKNEEAIAKLKSAARGYSGAFDVVKIKEEKLNMLYQFDSGLITDIENVNSKFDELERKAGAGEDIKQTVSDISTALDAFLQKFTDRENLLRAFQ